MQAEPGDQDVAAGHGVRKGSEPLLQRARRRGPDCKEPGQAKVGHHVQEGIGEQIGEAAQEGLALPLEKRQVLNRVRRESGPCVDGAFDVDPTLEQSSYSAQDWYLLIKTAEGDGGPFHWYTITVEMETDE